MNTRLTLADVRAILYPMVNPSDANDPVFLQMINEVQERFINSGKWKGSIVALRIASSSGFITMPYNYAAALAMTYDRYPFPIFTEFHQYVEEGPGKMDETLNWPGILIDLGDGFCTQADIPAAGVVRVYSSALDDGDTVRIYGNLNGVTVYDASGNEGEEVTLASPFVATTNQFTEITGFSAAEAIGATPAMLRSGKHGPEFYAAMYESIRTSGARSGWTKPEKKFVAAKTNNKPNNPGRAVMYFQP